MLIGQNSVVSIHYRLTNNAGEVLDESPEGAPMTYLHGFSNIIPGLENELTGKAVGAQFDVVVEPAQAYGEHRPELMQEVPRSAFPDGDDITSGMRFSAESDQGVLSVVVTEVNPETVTVDANHPLAGQELHFSVSVEEVRDATPEEVSHGHVHGPEGHAH